MAGNLADVDIVTMLHASVGWAPPIGFLFLSGWSVYALIRNRDPHERFWTLLGTLQVVIGVELILGGLLFFSGRVPNTDGPTWLHYIYGAVFPALVLAIAHARARKAPAGPWLIFGLAAFVCGFSTIRALGTGYGWF